MKNNFKEFKCDACGTEDEIQMHLLECKNIKQEENKMSHDISYELRYNDLFSKDIIKMVIVGKKLQRKMKIIQSVFKKVQIKQRKNNTKCKVNPKKIKNKTRK